MLRSSSIWRYRGGTSRATLIGLAKPFSTSKELLSAHFIQSRNTLKDINALYRDGKKITMLTAHDSITGRIAENAGVDICLVGDSLAMTTLGMEDTTELTFDEFLFHVKSVTRGNRTSFLVADVPFGSFEVSMEKSMESAIQLVKQGKAQAVKIEGADEFVIPKIKALVKAGIPVIGHTGLTPQKHNVLGGFKVQGTNVEEAIEILNDSIRLQDAGCFAVLLECIPNKLAKIITEKLSVPTIGIGAGPYCSGQVLVTGDALGMTDSKTSIRPKFARAYLDFHDQAVNAISTYKSDVTNGVFPDENQHGFKIKSEVLREVEKEAEKIK